MADSKISALPASTTPLAGTEVLPIVQSSTTKQVSVANLTAGRDIAAATVKATTTMGVGAATPSTSGAGVTFPASQSASSDVNTLDDYEEGTWTPLLESDAGSAAGKTYTTQSGQYTKIGNVVYFTFLVTFSNAGSSNVNEANLRGLPFSVGANLFAYMQSWANVGAVSTWFGLVPRSTTTTYISTLTAAGTSTSLYISTSYQNTTSFRGGGFYYI